MDPVNNGQGCVKGFQPEKLGSTVSLNLYQTEKKDCLAPQSGVVHDGGGQAAFHVFLRGSCFIFSSDSLTQLQRKLCSHFDCQGLGTLQRARHLESHSLDSIPVCHLLILRPWKDGNMVRRVD